jgi:hypothetical protein
MAESETDSDGLEIETRGLQLTQMERALLLLRPLHGELARHTSAYIDLLTCLLQGSKLQEPSGVKSDGPSTLSSSKFPPRVLKTCGAFPFCMLPFLCFVLSSSSLRQGCIDATA